MTIKFSALGEYAGENGKKRSRPKPRRQKKKKRKPK
jgi:hypothetical protein